MNPSSRNQLEIRRANVSELGILTEIAIAAKRYWGYSVEDMSLWIDELTITPRDLQKKKIFVADSDGVILGFYSIMDTEIEGTYELDDLWIEPAHIGKGLGARLFRHAAATVHGQGGSALRLVAEPHAIGFYQKMGMHRIGQRAGRAAGRTLDVMAFSLPIDSHTS